MKVSLLSNEQVHKIHAASMEILETIGVHVPHDQMLRLLGDAGARVDKHTQIAKIPETLVVHCLEVAGKEFTIHGRDRSKQAGFGVGKRNYNSSAGQAFWVDGSLKRRYATLEDVRTATRLADALPRVNIVGAMADPHEIPVAYRCVLVAAEQLKNTTKPITFWFHDRASARCLLELFTIVAGSEESAIRHPFAYPLLEPISPLRFPRHGIDLLFETSRFNLPVPIGPMPQTGATAVGTLAGTMAQGNAEILAGLCVVQLIKPGTPVCYGGIPHVFDMRTTQIVFGGPEQALMAVGMTQMGKYYHLPVYINVGLTDSKVPDAQAGLEAGITLAVGAMAGADIFGHLGIAGADHAASLEMLILQHEIIGYIERMLQGIEVTDEKFGIETIEHAREEGYFLAQEHTVRHFRQELWFPQLLDRRSWNAWIDDGKKNLMLRCREMKERILREHVPTPLDDDVGKDIDRFLQDVKRYFSRKPPRRPKSRHAAGIPVR
jgi:trimethylamine--corrinoid protein Co-methyltransferase